MPRQVPPAKKLSPFASVARQIRQAKGISQIGVAKAGGLGRGYIAMLESGERGGHPSRDSVLRVARGLDATLEERNALLKAAGFPIDSLPEGFGDLDLRDIINAQPDLTAQAKKLLVGMYEQLRAQG